MCAICTRTLISYTRQYTCKQACLLITGSPALQLNYRISAAPCSSCELNDNHYYRTQLNGATTGSAVWPFIINWFHTIQWNLLTLILSHSVQQWLFAWLPMWCSELLPVHLEWKSKNILCLFTYFKALIVRFLHVVYVQASDQKKNWYCFKSSPKYSREM